MCNYGLAPSCTGGVQLAGLRCSAFQAWICALRAVLGLSCSTVSGCREKGSVVLLSRWRMMEARSTLRPLGSSTGSSIRLYVIGSCARHSSDKGQRWFWSSDSNYSFTQCRGLPLAGVLS